MRQSVYDDTEKGFMKYIKHLTPGSCIDGHQPPPQISSQDLKSEYPPEPATQSVIIPDIDLVMIPIIIINHH